MSQDVTKKTHLSLICHLRQLTDALPVSIISVSLYLGKVDEGGILEGGKGEDSSPCTAPFYG